MNTSRFDIKALYSAEQIAAEVARLGREIDNAYKETPSLYIIGLLRGSFIFLADLVRTLHIPAEIDFMAATSYGQGSESSGNVKIVLDLDANIAGRDVLVVEDIVDTGRTFSKILELLEGRSPKSLRTCALLDKPSRRVTSVPLHFRGFEIPDVFVVGYGLDFDQRYRHLPYIGMVL